MFFTINAYKTFLVINNGYRLKNDGSWVLQKDFKKIDMDNDKIFKTHKEAEQWLIEHKKVIINNEETEVKPLSASRLGNVDFSFKIIVHRKSKPHVFTKDELIHVLKKSTNLHEENLIIDFNGNLKIINKLDSNFIDFEAFAVKHENFKNEKYSKIELTNAEHLEKVYINMLEGWMFHLESGVSVSVDFYRTIDEESILNEVRRLCDELALMKI